MKIFWRIISFAKPYKSFFISSMVFMILNTIFEGVSIFSIVPFMDKVLTGQPVELNTSIELPFMDSINRFLAYLSSLDRMQLFVYLGFFLLIMFCIKGIAYYYSHVLMEKLGQNMVKDIRCKIFDHMEHMSIDFFSQGKTGALMSRITSDVQMILEIISGRFANTLIELPKFFIYAAILIIIDWKLMMALALLPFIVLPIILIGKKIRSLSRRAQNRLAELNSVLFEVITGIKIVQAFSMEQAELQRFINENIKYYQTRIKAIKLDTLLNPLTEITGIIICLGIMFLKVPRIIDGDLSVGTFTLQAAALVALIKPLKTLGKINSLYQRAIGAAERIFQILDTQPAIVECSNPIVLAPIRKKIEFCDVSFSYEKDEHIHNVLKNLSFTVNKGEIVAFVGPSGAGKTTILNMVPRFYDPQQGSILIDDTDLRNVSFRSLRDQISIVTQETILFNDSVLGNIAYGKEKILQDEVINAAKIANAHEFISAMPDGYNTIIGERGVKLSGGQKQRISIARAILKDPAILILDEATSALDSESEKLVQEAINRIMEHRTVLVVAHRLSTILHADKIFVLDNGTIQACGTHNNLLETNTVYRKLYEMQFGMTGNPTQETS
ncbi:MAG: ABC transporter ATP-binding protein [Candidatus Auribacterota bacterium]|jgi:subfamily B ATP-binding cassette protein MsbA|nr:ABC transporter ATP-binding protein [Candidatus Auribacterota bacterium]